MPGHTDIKFIRDLWCMKWRCDRFLPLVRFHLLSIFPPCSIPLTYHRWYVALENECFGKQYASGGVWSYGMRSMHRSTCEDEGITSLLNVTNVSALDLTRPTDLPTSLTSKPNFEGKVGIIAFRCGGRPNRKLLLFGRSPPRIKNSVLPDLTLLVRPLDTKVDAEGRSCLLVNGHACIWEGHLCPIGSWILEFNRTCAARLADEQ